MVGAVVFAYGMMATFVHSSAVRNMKQGRDHSPALQLTGWTLISGSAAGALMVGLYGAYSMVSGAL